MVVVDVGGDRLSCLVEGLELVQPDAAFLQLREPGFDERLALGVAVAAAAMGDPAPGERELEVAGGEGGAVVGAEGERVGPDRAGGGGLGERPKVCVCGLAVLCESVLEVGVEGGEAFVPAGHGAFPVGLVVSDREVDELAS